MAANTLAACARRGRVLVVSLIVLLCLVSVGFMNPGVIAQEDRWSMARDPTVLTVEREKAQAAKPGSDFKECAKPCDDRHPCWQIHYGLAGERVGPGWQ